MNWYAIRTQNNKEKSVLEKLNLEIDRFGTNTIIGRTLVPMEKIVMTKNGKKFLREKTIYPGYVFVETSALGEVASILKGIQGAAGFVRSRSGDIQPIKDHEIKNLLQVQDEKRETLDNLTKFNIDDNINITDGPFSGFKGKVQEVMVEKQRAKIGVLVFGRITNIELDFNQIERVY